jgi:hypothetical protein
VTYSRGTARGEVLTNDEAVDGPTGALFAPAAGAHSQTISLNLPHDFARYSVCPVLRLRLPACLSEPPHPRTPPHTSTLESAKPVLRDRERALTYTHGSVRNSNCGQATSAKGR